ncbi:MAG TPA: penicillin-binding protein 2 [Candidatus Sulfopaludibacter sp.]|nr:penicillin-binding protein 2 [Candidatus Sulfopaludibacter sp.]
MIVPPVDPNLEQRVSDKPPLRDDTNFASGRIAAFQYASVVIFLFLISGFWRLQVQNPQWYDEKALQNSIKSVPITAPRGRILDRDGRVIVDNHFSYLLYLTRESLKEEHLKPIAQGLDLDYNDLLARVQRFRSRPKYEPIVLKREASPADLAFVASHHDFFPELVLVESQRRLYPQNGMLAHVIGYTGEISDAELDMPEFAKYRAGDVIGKFGVERQYNSTLMGVDGQRQVVVDNRGQVRDVLAEKPAVSGKDLQLTIDLDLQVVAELAMDAPVNELHVEHKTGAVVALDPRSGDILAMASRPTFDLNKFAERIKAKDWEEMNQNPDHPLMNKAIQDQQPPGSTFKPFTALAGLESGAIDDQFTVDCRGGVALYGRFQKCWVYPKGHGRIALHRGIVDSCDTYFYTVGAKTGIDNLAYYGDLVGFGHPTGVDLPHEASGVMPSAQWKLRYYRQKWYAGETPSVAIGQGALIVTPLQLARALGGIAMGGTWHRPRVVESQPDKVVQWSLNPENVKDVVEGMYGVVNEGGGTGGRARLPNVRVCGKTGTAQLTSEDYAKSKGKKTSDDNAWFEAFAPCEAPEIVVVALFEHFPGHGQYAAPIVRDVMKAYFDKKTRVAAMGQATAKLGSFGNSLTPAPAPQQPAAGTEPEGDEGMPQLDKSDLAPAEPPAPAAPAAQGPGASGAWPGARGQGPAGSQSPPGAALGDSRQGGAMAPKSAPGGGGQQAAPKSVPNGTRPPVGGPGAAKPPGPRPPTASPGAEGAKGPRN